MDTNEILEVAAMKLAVNRSPDDEELIQRFENALERMRQGQFGVCEGCSCTIPMARLNALPYATLCIDCQRENERHGQANGRGAEDLRWAKVYDKPLGDSESDSDVKLSDFEMDLSESGR